MLGDDRWRTALADDLHIAKTGLRQQIRYRLGAAVHLRPPSRIGPHRFDSNQVFKVAPYRRQYLAHTLNQISHARRRHRPQGISRMATAAAVSPSCVSDT
jgi:hypothetical protein